MSRRGIALRALFCGTAALTVGCSQQELARTELVVRVDAEERVIQLMHGGKLQITVHTESLQGESGTDRREFLIGDLVWPADVHVVPDRSNDRSDQVEIVVDALDSGGRAIAEQRALVTFDPRKKHVLSLRLHKCGPSAYYELCTPQNTPCHGSQCLTCRDDTQACGETPMVAGADLPTLDVAAGPGAHDPGQPVGGGAEPAHNPDSAEQDAGFAAQLSDASVDGAVSFTSLDAMAGALPDGSEPMFTDAMAPLAAHGDCSMSPRWVSARSSGPIPAEARALSHVNIPAGGPLYDQFVCRVSDGAGGVIPGKVNGIAGSFDFGCFYAAPGTPTWRGLPVDSANQTFELLVPVAGCTLSLVPVLHLGALALPANAVITGEDASHTPLYSCNVNMTDAKGPSTGRHFGRVSGAANDPCRLQFFTQVPPTSTSFEILVQTPEPP